MTEPASTLPTLDVERLDATLAFVLAHPEVHRQAAWVAPSHLDASVQMPDGRTICGAAGCFAGWAVLIDRPDLTLWSDGAGDAYLIPTTAVDRVGDSWAAAYPESVDVMDAARATLGLTDLEAMRLFNASNTRDDLARIVERIKAGVYR